MYTTLEKLDTNFLELNKICPLPISMYAFFEAMDLKREDSGSNTVKNDNDPSRNSTKQPAANSAEKMEQVSRDQISSNKKSRGQVTNARDQNVAKNTRTVIKNINSKQSP